MSEGTDYSVWELANAADTYSPDGHQSPGAEWLTGLQRDWREWEGDRLSDDQRRQFADSAVYTLESRGTWGKWRVFVDLGAWNSVDDDDTYRSAGTISDMADVILTEIAYGLAITLSEDSAWTGDDAEEESDDRPE